MARIQLPPGCDSLKFKDGRGRTKVYNAPRPGTSVVVDDDHARGIRGSRNGELGIINGQLTLGIATRKGRWCVPCRFLAQAWSIECPKCGRPTIEEGDT